MKRYTLLEKEDFYEDRQGDWVRYEDAKKEIDMYRKYLITLCE